VAPVVEFGGVCVWGILESGGRFCVGEFGRNLVSVAVKMFSHLISFRNKRKKKSVPLHAMEAHGGKRRYSSYSYLTSALDGVNGQRNDSAPLYPQGKDPRYPLDRRLGGPQSRSGSRG
jgi:hypothetical protein